MKKTFLVIIGFGLIVSVSLAFTKNDPVYKNLQVLPKDITKQQMDSVMHHFTASLNVRCNFCHVRNDSAKTNDFVSDANPHKNKSREMMKMTDKINEEYFDVTGKQRDLTTPLMITCYTCHRGSKEPAVKAPQMHEMHLHSVNDTTQQSQ